MINPVFTLGDSTLDNIVWVNDPSLPSDQVYEDAKKHCVEGKLRTELGPQYEVISCAYDGFTTTSVLKGSTIGKVFGKADPRYLAYKGSGPVQPLEQLKNQLKPGNIVVISVGGNAFREILGHPIAQNDLGIFKIVSKVSEIRDCYLKIVDEVQKMGGRPILMLQYRTNAVKDYYKIYPKLRTVGKVAAGVNIASACVISGSALAIGLEKITVVTGLICMIFAAIILKISSKFVPLKVTTQIIAYKDPGMSMMNALMEKFYRHILERAKKEKLPILDLPNSFDPYDNELYQSGIEPSRKGGALIAKGLANIIQKYDNKAPSKLYDCSGNIAENVPEKWAVK